MNCIECLLLYIPNPYVILTIHELFRKKGLFKGISKDEL